MDLNKPLVIDVESTTSSKGSPFDLSNKLVMVGTKCGSGHEEVLLAHHNQMPPDAALISKLQHQLTLGTCLVGFNLKFDIHWLSKLGKEVKDVIYGKDWWDCQLAAFILQGQSQPYPSLDDCCLQAGLPRKTDIVKTQYWDIGIDTDDIPIEVLGEYLENDLRITELLQIHQRMEFRTHPEQFRLFKLAMLDCKVLSEMESAGLRYNFDKALRLEGETDEKIKELRVQLGVYANGCPVNWNSGDHLSRILYGGTIVCPISVPNGVFASGARIGQTRYKWETKEYRFDGLFKPPKGSELKKAGFYATDEKTIKQLPQGSAVQKTLIRTLLEIGKLEKLNSTYYKGLRELREKMHWNDGFIHGQFNQCVAATGRLSSSRPNLQNFSGEVNELLETRFP